MESTCSEFVNCKTRGSKSLISSFGVSLMAVAGVALMSVRGEFVGLTQ